MAKTPLISIRCPNDLLQIISEEQEATTLSRSEVVVERLRQSIPSIPLRTRGKLPAVPAIYFVYTLSNRLLYIGRSNNLKRRWAEHHRFSQFIELDPECRVAWFAFDEEQTEDLQQIERELLDELETEYNGSTVTGKGSHLLSFRCPDELLELIEQTCKTSQQSKTEVIIEKLKMAFGLSETPEIPESKFKTQISEIFERLNEYEDRLKKLSA